jgi:glucose/arabinose dehydrogenase
MATWARVPRLNEDGTVPVDNPFANQGEVAAQVWTLGHRNSLGIAFDAQGRLWAHEMGPQNGDELNLIVRGENYGWPLAGRPFPITARGPNSRRPSSPGPGSYHQRAS